MQLPSAQVAVLEAADAQTDRPITDIAAEADLKPEAATRAAFELEDEGLLSVSERTEETVDLTAEGERYVDEGLPEVRLYGAALAAGAAESPVGLGEDRILGLFFGSDKQDRFVLGGHLGDKLPRRLPHPHRLTEVDDVDTVAGPEDVGLHLRMPAVGLVTEVDPRLQKIFHLYFGHK